MQLTPKLLHISQHLIILQHRLITPLHIPPLHILLNKLILIPALLRQELDLGNERGLALFEDVELVSEVLRGYFEVDLHGFDLGYFLEFLHLEFTFEVHEGDLELVLGFFEFEDLLVFEFDSGVQGVELIDLELEDFVEVGGRG